VPSFANDVFVVLSEDGAALPDEQRQHLAFFDDHVRQLARAEGKADSTGVVITTHNRPRALARTLRALSRTGRPMLVVDDRSSRENRIRNR
jgi:hypothetical protein